MRAKVVEAAGHPVNPVGGLNFTVRPDGLRLLPATPEGERWRPGVPGTPGHVHTSALLFLDCPEARELERGRYAPFDHDRDRRRATCGARPLPERAGSPCRTRAMPNSCRAAVRSV
ncbi:hypothetical protein [Deinococcus hopiensis]|uniref:hypothetical protein n=1 Tax=Deinococcus hopiensis TaxID=309885 RepID=UPI00111BF0DB|nr:hypothetical protein [Deinococcus hopiensis]